LRGPDLQRFGGISQIISQFSPSAEIPAPVVSWRPDRAAAPAKKICPFDFRAPAPERTSCPGRARLGMRSRRTMATRARNIAELEGLPDWPALMRAPVAAAYLSLTAAEFERGVGRAELPPPRRTTGGPRWSRRDLDRWFEDGPAAARSEHDALSAAIEATWGPA
jgi:hypothetical protein